MKTTKRLITLAMAILLMFTFTACGSSSPDTWAKNVEIQVPAKAGGGTDVMARTLATQVAKDAGNTLTVINNSDGGGVVAMEKVRTAKADGSQILQFHTTMLIKTAIGVYDKSAYEDFTVIGVSQSTETGGYVLVVSAESGYETLEDFLSEAKSRPGELLLGVETGGSAHIMSGMLASETGIDVKYVEAGSDTEKLTALVGKSIDACLVNPNQAKQYIEAESVTALAVFSATDEGLRSTVLPEVPSFSELGYPLVFATINLFLGPKDMDPVLAETIYSYYAAAAQNSDVNAVLTPAGFEMNFYPFEEGPAIVQEHQEKITEVVEMLGLKQ